MLLNWLLMSSLKYYQTKFVLHLNSWSNSATFPMHSIFTTLYPFPFLHIFQSLLITDKHYLLFIIMEIENIYPQNNTWRFYEFWKMFFGIYFLICVVKFIFSINMNSVITTRQQKYNLKDVSLNFCFL